MLKLPFLPVMAAAFALAAVAMSGSMLRAQEDTDGPIKMTPEFSLTFPFAYDQKSGVVSVKYPVLINGLTVLKPGVTLRTLYVLQQTGGDSGDLSVAHATDQSEAYARSFQGADATSTAKMPYAMAHELEGYRRTVWSTPTNFQLAMAQFPTDQMHLIYAIWNAGDQKDDLHDQRFNFFDGLLVGQPNGTGVVVLAVENDSKANEAGIKAGDEIVAVGGTPLKDDLRTFATAFSASRQNARDMNQSSYTMTIHSPGDAGTHDVKVAMPPSIHNSLLHSL